MDNLEIFDKNGKALHIADVMAMLPKEHLTRLVWDGFLTAERQDEHWHDEDTCRLIVQKILNNEKIEYAKGNLP
jgi:hypothetical protein